MTTLQSTKERSWWRPTLRGGMATTVGTTIVIQAMNLASGVILARSLGPSDRGLLAAAMLWPTLLAAVGGLGIAEAVTYSSGREASGPSPILSSAVALAVVQTVVLTLLGVFILPIVLAGNSAAALPAATYYLAIIPVNLLSLYPVALLQGRMNLGAFNVARLSVHVAYTGLLIALWSQRSLSVRSALTASLVATAVTGVLSFWLIGRRGYWVWRLIPGAFRSLITFGASIHLGNVATIVASKLDIVVLTLFVSAGVLGTYAVASAVGMVVAMVPGAIAMVLYPRFVHLSTADRRITLSRLLLIAIAVALTVGPLMLIALPRLIPVVFGKAFTSGVPVAEVLVVGYLFRGYSGMLVAMLRGSGSPLRASSGEIVGLILFAALLPVLTWRFGSLGTASALALAAAAMLIWVVSQACSISRLTAGQLWLSWKADVASLATASKRR